MLVTTQPYQEGKRKRERERMYVSDSVHIRNTTAAAVVQEIKTSNSWFHLPRGCLDTPLDTSTPSVISPKDHGPIISTFPRPYPKAFQSFMHKTWPNIWGACRRKKKNVSPSDSLVLPLFVISEILPCQIVSFVFRPKSLHSCCVRTTPPPNYPTTRTSPGKKEKRINYTRKSTLLPSDAAEK